ncbi:hypothetical protein BJY00DRAFT_33008 [Aspergillus carlsbadensis]|nr:hypothetical protein BJY00DRAFT_33008 [Aspergillus carlsbadensis]
MAIKRSESPTATPSGGELWTPEDAHRLLELRVLHADLTWDQFHKLGFFPGRTLHSLRRKHEKLLEKAARARQLNKISYRASTGSVPAKRPPPHPAPYPAQSTKRSRSETRMGGRGRLGYSSKAKGADGRSPSSRSTSRSSGVADDRRNVADEDDGDINFDGSTRRLRHGLRSQRPDSGHQEPPQDVASPEWTSTSAPTTTTRPRPASDAPSCSNSRHGLHAPPLPHNAVPPVANHADGGPKNNRAPGVDTRPLATLPPMRWQPNLQQSPKSHSLPPMPRLVPNPPPRLPTISVQLPPLSTIRSPPVSETAPSPRISEGRFATVQSCPPATLASPAQGPPAHCSAPEKIASPNRTPAQDQQRTRQRSVSPARFLRDAAETLLQRADVLEQQKPVEANKRAQLEAENTRLRKKVEDLEGTVKKGETELEKLRKEMEDRIAALNKNASVLQEELEKYGKLKDVLKTLI